MGLDADLVGRERATNKIDIAYLYCPPFCMAFTSRDKLHEKTAPLFLDTDQEFIRGDDLETDLAKLGAHYSQLSDEEKLRGVMSFAHYPPVEGDFLASKLWDKLMRPEWRDWARKLPEKRSKESDAKIMAEIDEIAEAPRLSIEDLDQFEEPEAVLVLAKSAAVSRQVENAAARGREKRDWMNI